MGGILKALNLCEILEVYLVDRLYLSVVVTGNKYCIFWSGSGGCQKYIAIGGKFRRIWQNGLQNLEKFAAENCCPQTKLYKCCSS